MEMVSAMRDHKHWPIIEEWIRWCGYEIKWSTVARLVEMAPQHRDRLLIIATRNDATTLAPHRCISWPKTDPFTLQTFQAVIELEYPWLQQATPNPDVLQKYLDPSMLPKSSGGDGNKAKKTKRDVEAYRLRFPQGVAACIMANYSYAHLLPQSTLEKRGLIGSLLITPKGIRFFGIPELVILFSPTNEVWLPLDGRLATHMIGNSIAIPHAALSLCNALAFLYPNMTQVEVQELIVAVHAHRLHAGNMTWNFDLEGVRFSLKPHEIETTQPMHETFQVTISSPTKTWNFRCEPGICLVEIISVLTGKSVPLSFSIVMGTELHSKVQMPHDFVMPRADVVISVAVPSVMMIEQTFREISPQILPYLIVLTPSGIMALRRDHVMDAREVGHYLMHFDDSFMLPEIASILGERIPEDTVTPTCFMALKHGRSCQDFEVVRTLKINVDASMITLHGSETALKEFAHMLKSSGTLQLLHAVGWNLSYPIQCTENDELISLEIGPIPNRLNMLLQDVSMLIVSRLFVDFVQHTGPTMSIFDEGTVQLKLKLWELHAWNGLVPQSFSIKPWAQAWEDLVRMFDLRLPIRFVVHGHQINPDFPLDRFILPHHGSCPVMRIHIVMGLHGGGPTDTISLTESSMRTSSEIPESINRTIAIELADQESNDFEGVVSRMVDDWFQSKAIVAVEANFEDILTLSYHSEDGLLFFDGSLRACMALLQMFEDHEVTAALHRFGWLIAVEFRQCKDPVITRVVLVPRAMSTVSCKAIESFLHTCFLTIALPSSGISILDCVLVRLKIWGVVVFVEWIHKTCPVQRFLDAWDTANQILQRHIEVRVISRGRRLNPDFALEDYARTNDEGLCNINLHFVVALHGGGGNETKRDGEIHQRNNLATFLLQEKCDLKDVSACVDKIVPAAGSQAIQDIFTLRTKHAKWEAMNKLARALAIDIPSGIDKIIHAQKRTFEKFKKQAFDVIADVDIKQITIKEGFFLNHDDSPCKQQWSIAPQTTGVVLLKPDEAQQWIAKSTQLSSDELGIVVIGSCVCDASHKGKKVHIPAYDHRSQPLVLSGCFHDLGAKKIKIATNDDAKVPVHDTCIISWTVFRDELEPSAWETLIESPVKQTLELALGTSHDFVFTTPPWGRTYQKDKIKVAPKEATSMQFHARIEKSALSRILKLSGSTGVYTTLKTEQKKISPDYQVIWLHMSRVDLLCTISTYDNHFGLVRNGKTEAKASRGIRFAKGDFEQAFKELKPHDVIPKVVAPNFIYRVSPVPVGASLEHVATWIDQQKWVAKPLKSVNASTWLIAAAEAIPNQFAMWNGETLLIKPVASDPIKTPIVLAGSLPKKTNGPENTASTQLRHDPWAEYNAKKQVFVGGNGGVNAPVSGLPSAITRKLEGPIESRFQQQGQEIQQIKDATQEIETMKQDIVLLRQAFETQKQQTEEHQKAVKQEFQQVRHESKEQISALATSFETSLAQSISHQEKQMMHQFSELKTLLLERPSSQPSKKAKPHKPNTEIADMEEDS